MSGSLDDRFFDYTFQVLNYAIEFVDVPGYASARFTKTLENAVNLSLEIDGIEKKAFYEMVLVRISEWRAMPDSKNRNELLNELLSIYVDEGRK
jgi:hypothetical protein